MKSELFLEWMDYVLMYGNRAGHTNAIDLWLSYRTKLGRNLSIVEMHL